MCFEKWKKSPFKNIEWYEISKKETPMIWKLEKCVYFNFFSFSLCSLFNFSNFSFCSPFVVIFHSLCTGLMWLSERRVNVAEEEKLIKHLPIFLHFRNPKKILLYKHNTKTEFHEKCWKWSIDKIFHFMHGNQFLLWWRWQMKDYIMNIHRGMNIFPFFFHSQCWSNTMTISSKLWFIRKFYCCLRFTLKFKWNIFYVQFLPLFSRLSILSLFHVWFSISNLRYQPIEKWNEICCSVSHETH